MFKLLPTIKDIAKETGVSTATVSRVLNGRNKGYSDETRQSILETANRLGYIQNKSAVSLVSKKSNIIGVIMPHYSTTFMGETIVGIEDELYLYGYNLFLTRAGIEGARMQESIHLMQEHTIDGYIIASSALTPEDVALIKKVDIPCVLLSTNVPNDELPAIKIDDWQAEFDATQFLIDKGCKKIALVGLNVTDRVAGKPRVEGFKEALLQNNLSFSEDDVYPGYFTIESGEKAMEQIIAENKNYDGILCASDETASGVLSVCQKHKIRIPEDLSIVGYDDSMTAKIAALPLTTVAQPFEELARVSASTLIKHLKGQGAMTSTTMMHKIVERDSTKK